MECGAILDIVALLRIVPDDELGRAKQTIRRVAEMLSKMCR
jgi:hypothetical protein